MAIANRSKASIRLFGDTLNPDDITKLLGKPATQHRLKDEVQLGVKTGNVWLSKTGAWILEAQEREPADLIVIPNKIGLL